MYRSAHGTETQASSECQLLCLTTMGQYNHPTRWSDSSSSWPVSHSAALRSHPSLFHLFYFSLKVVALQNWQFYHPSFWTIPLEIAHRGHISNTPADKRDIVASTRSCSATFAAILQWLSFMSPLSPKESEKCCKREKQIYAIVKGHNFKALRVTPSKMLQFVFNKVPCAYNTKAHFAKLHKTQYSPTSTGLQHSASSQHNTITVHRGTCAYW